MDDFTRLILESPRPSSADDPEHDRSYWPGCALIAPLRWAAAASEDPGRPPMEDLVEACERIRCYGREHHRAPQADALADAIAQLAIAS